MALYKGWLKTGTTRKAPGSGRTCWRIHAEQQFSIGTVAGEIQPIVVNTRMRNVPEKAIFSWEPTSLMGIYRIDEFWFET